MKARKEGSDEKGIIMYYNIITAKMKKLRFLVIVYALCIGGITYAQNDNLIQYHELERKKFKLAIIEFDRVENQIKQTVLEKEQLQTLLSEGQFSTYNHARRCYHASIPLLSLAACGIVTTTIYFGFWVDSKFHPEKYRFPNGKSYLMGLPVIIFGVATLPFLISGTTLIVYSAKKLDRIAKNYNKLHNSSFYQSNIQLNFGITPNGIGMKINF